MRTAVAAPVSITAHQSAGDQWLLVYDRMPFDDHVSFSSSSCDSVSVDPKTLIISGEGCSDRRDGLDTE